MREINYSKLQAAVEVMDNQGIEVDLDKVAEIETNLSEALEYANSRLNAIAAQFGMKIQVNSVRQVKELVYNKLGLQPSLKRVGKDLVPDYSTNAKALDYVRKVNLGADVEALDLIAGIRSYNKLLHWAGALRASLVDGKLYCNHNIDGTVSGRFTCTGQNGSVNFHNIPREFKQTFVA